MNQDYIISFPEKITSHIIYTFISTQLGNIAENKYSSLTFDLAKTTYITPTSFPLLLCIGSQIYKKYGIKTNLWLTENINNVSLINTMFYSSFFTYAKNYFVIDPSIEGGINRNNDNENKLSDRYGVGQFFPDLNYPLLKDPLLKKKKRAIIHKWVNIACEKLSFFQVINEYFPSRTKFENSLEINFHEQRVQDFLVEVISNGILHSEGETYVYGQSTRPKKEKNYFIRNTSFSIADTGIGFKKSLDQKNIKIDYRNFDSRNINIYFEDLLVILNVLEYSKSFSNERDNLSEVVKYFVRNKGIVRFHFNQTQLIYTHHLCHNCLISSFLNCIDCFAPKKEINTYNVKTYTLPINGVHVELELDNKIPTRGLEK